MFKLVCFSRKLLIVPMKIITIPIIPFSWVILLLIIILISGGDEGEFNNDFNNLNQATKQIFTSCTKGLFY